MNKNTYILSINYYNKSISIFILKSISSSTFQLPS